MKNHLRTVLESPMKRQFFRRQIGLAMCFLGNLACGRLS